MSVDVVTAHPDTSVKEAARFMAAAVTGLPVVDGEDRLLGVASRAEVLAVVTRPDEAIEQDTPHQIIGHAPAIEPHQVAVERDEGHGGVDGQCDGIWSVESEVRFLVGDT